MNTNGKCWYAARSALRNARLQSLMLVLAIAACGDASSDEGAGEGGANAGNSGEAGSAGNAGNAGSSTMSTSGDSGGDGASGTNAGASSSAGTASDPEDGSVADASDDASALEDASTADADIGYEEANNDCLDDIADYASTGPFQFEPVTTMTADMTGEIKLWVPDVPPGCKVPIVHFMNGRGVTCARYRASLEHLASHGFLVSCYESAEIDDGAHCVTAIETVLEEYPDLADLNVGSSGHCTGGSLAISCVKRAEERWGPAMRITGHAVEPEPGFGGDDGWQDAYRAVTSPMFVVNGSVDSLVTESSVGRSFDALNPDIEAYWYEGTGATHTPEPLPWIQESAVAWFRWKLLGDAAACEYFKAMPSGDDWDLQMTRNPTDC